MNKPNVPTLLLAVLVVLVGWHVLVNANTPPANAGAAAGPAEPYVVQISATHAANTWQGFLYRLWSDGAVDSWYVSNSPGSTDTLWYGWVPLDPVQRADLNADGCVDAPDLLELLAAWNPCP